MTDQKQYAGQQCHLRMFDVQVSAVTCVNAERNKRSSRQLLLNFFWVHDPSLSIVRRFLNAQLRRRRFAEMRGVRGVGGEIVEHGVGRAGDRF